MTVNAETISYWAQIAAVYLAICTFITTLALGAIYGGAWWYLRKGRKWLAMPLLMAQVYTLRVQHITTKVANGIGKGVIETNVTVTQVSTTAEVAGKSLVRVFKK